MHQIPCLSPQPAQSAQTDPINQTALSMGHLEFWPGADEDAPVIDEFVRKLYNLLEDESSTNNMCWGSQGNVFVIKDVGAFSADILGRVFKYANFASFVRQLNKYDFHKVKSSDDDGLNDHTWMFRHRDFRKGDLKALESIRRKVPGTRTKIRPANGDDSTTPSGLADIQAQIERMSVQQDELSAHVQDMHDDYAGVLGGLVNLQRTFVQRDHTMRQIMEYTMQMNNSDTPQ